MPRKKYKRHTRKERTKKPEKLLRVLGSLLKTVLESLLGLVMALGQLLWLGLVGLVLWLWQLLWLGQLLGAVLVLLGVALVLLESVRAKRRRPYTTTSWLASLLSEDYNAEVNTVRYRLEKQKCPKWLIKTKTTMCLFNMYRGWILVKLQNIWLSINLRL